MLKGALAAALTPLRDGGEALDEDVFGLARLIRVNLRVLQGDLAGAREDLLRCDGLRRHDEPALGLDYDSSVFPIRHDRYGIPVSARHPYLIDRPQGRLVEVPASTAEFAGTKYWRSRSISK